MTVVADPSTYVACFPLQEYFVDKDTGLPLAAGVVKFYFDSDEVTPKNVYKQTGSSAGGYTYTSIGSTITLSSVGTFTDNLGNDIIPFLWPFVGDPQNTVPNPVSQKYYITVVSSGGEPQFTRSNWPPLQSSTGAAASASFVNQFVFNPGNTGSYALSSSSVKSILVQMIAGGGGGQGGGTSPGTGGIGGNTTFGTSYLTCYGGNGGGTGAAGNATGGDINVVGNSGSGPSFGTGSSLGGTGAASFFGSGGSNTNFSNQAGHATTTYGAGGAGGGATINVDSGYGGGSGGYLSKFITGNDLQPSYSYAVGVGGTGGTVGTSGNVGGAGGGGIIIIQEFA